MRYFYLTILVFFFGAIQASNFLNLNEIRSILKKSLNSNVDPKRTVLAQGSMKRIQDRMEDDAEDRKLAQNKAKVLKKVRSHKVDKNLDSDLFSQKLTESADKRIGREYFLMDPVLNELRRRGKLTDFRKKGSDTDESGSSSLGIPDWKQEWNELWLQKKFEALNSSIIRGDVVNMAAARPWGRYCGDPNQHDAPWGTCMLPAECEPEYRIYRGDIHCGNTMYICCAIVGTKYDLYNGLDISFEDSEFGTDTNELIHQNEDASKKDRSKDRNKRKRDREKRKKKILRKIRKIVKEIRKILGNAYKNATSERKKRTKQLKKFIESMKKQYKKDRQAVAKVHDTDMIKIDDNLKAKLDHIKGLNENFMTNETFRNIIVNGSLSKRKLKRLLRSYPDLAKYMKQKRRSSLKNKRRSGIDLTIGVDPGDRAHQSAKLKPDKPDYDVEYGMLYY